MMKSLAVAILAFGFIASASCPAQAPAADPMRAALDDSKTSGKGLTFYVKGASIPGVVVSVSDKYVVAKSQAAGNIVIRIDSIDAVAGFK